MARACTVCASAQRQAVDAALGAGTPARQIGKTYGLGERAVQRHRVAHLSPAVVSVMATREERGAVRIVDRLENLIAKVSGLVDRAEKEGSTGMMLAAAREVRGGLELLARLTGELDERPTTTINLLSSPEVTMLFGVMDRSLTPWPAAKIALAAALNDAGVEPTG